MPAVETLNFILALGGVGLFLGTALLVFDLYTSKSLKDLVVKWGLMGAFLLTLVGSAMTLYYSEVLGFIPCGLCWMQRVFLYPQVFLLGTALYIRDTSVYIYGIVLSAVGTIFALYQHYLQMGGVELAKCPTAGEGANCAERILFEFGFMTFPLMSAALFLFLIALYYYLLKIRTVTGGSNA